jgi:hypothetical protein
MARLTARRAHRSSSVLAALQRLVGRWLHGVTSWDPWSLAASLVTLLVVALLAGWLAARRAARVERSLALRGE